MCLCSVASVFLTLCDSTDYSPPGSFVQGDSAGKNSLRGCHFLLQGIFSTQGSNPDLLCLMHWQADSLPLFHLGSPISPQAINQKAECQHHMRTNFATNYHTSIHSWKSLVIFPNNHLHLPTRATRPLTCCCSVTMLCPTLCDPMDCSMPGFPVLHHLLEFAQTLSN